MFFFFAAGSSTTRFDHGPILPLTCPRCNVVTYWRMIENRYESTVYFMNVSSSSHYALVCQSCGNGTMLNQEQAGRAIYIRQYTHAFFEKQITDEEYRERLNEVRYLH